MVSYAEVKSYLSKREIPQLFESLMAGLMYHRPENHISYLQSCLEELKTTGSETRVQWSTFVNGKKRKSRESLPPLTPKKQDSLSFSGDSRQSTPLPPISARSRQKRTTSINHQESIKNTYILYHNPPPVLSPPDVPVIFAIGGSGERIDALCEDVVHNIRGLVHISAGSMLKTRMIIEGFYRMTSIPSCAVVDSVLQAMSMVKSAKALLVAGFPRNRGDVEEYRSRRVRVDGAILVDFEEAALRRFLLSEVDTGLIKQSEIEYELDRCKQDLIAVAEYYDEKELLTVVMGDQDPQDILNDLIIAVDKILDGGNRASPENYEAQSTPPCVKGPCKTTVLAKDTTNRHFVSSSITEYSENQDDGNRSLEPEDCKDSHSPGDVGEISDVSGIPFLSGHIESEYIYECKPGSVINSANVPETEKPQPVDGQQDGKQDNGEFEKEPCDETMSDYGTMDESLDIEAVPTNDTTKLPDDERAVSRESRGIVEENDEENDADDENNVDDDTTVIDYQKQPTTPNNESQTEIVTQESGTEKTSDEISSSKENASSDDRIQGAEITNENELSTDIEQQSENQEQLPKAPLDQASDEQEQQKDSEISQENENVNELQTEDTSDDKVSNETDKNVKPSDETGKADDNIQDKVTTEENVTPPSKESDDMNSVEKDTSNNDQTKETDTESDENKLVSNANEVSHSVEETKQSEERDSEVQQNEEPKQQTEESVESAVSDDKESNIVEKATVNEEKENQIDNIDDSVDQSSTEKCSVSDDSNVEKEYETEKELAVENKSEGNEITQTAAEETSEENLQNETLDSDKLEKDGAVKQLEADTDRNDDNSEEQINDNEESKMTDDTPENQDKESKTELSESQNETETDEPGKPENEISEGEVSKTEASEGNEALSFYNDKEEETTINSELDYADENSTADQIEQSKSENTELEENQEQKNDAEQNVTDENAQEITEETKNDQVTVAESKSNDEQATATEETSENVEESAPDGEEEKEIEIEPVINEENNEEALESSSKVNDNVPEDKSFLPVPSEPSTTSATPESTETTLLIPRSRCASAIPLIFTLEDIKIDKELQEALVNQLNVTFVSFEETIKSHFFPTTLYHGLHLLKSTLLWERTTSTKGFVIVDFPWFLMKPENVDDFMSVGDITFLSHRCSKPMGETVSAGSDLIFVYFKDKISVLPTDESFGDNLISVIQNVVNSSENRKDNQVSHSRSTCSLKDCADTSTEMGFENTLAGRRCDTPINVSKTGEGDNMEGLDCCAKVINIWTANDEKMLSGIQEEEDENADWGEEDIVKIEEEANSEFPKSPLSRQMTFSTNFIESGGVVDNCSGNNCTPKSEDPVTNIVEDSINQTLNEDIEEQLEQSVQDDNNGTNSMEDNRNESKDNNIQTNPEIIAQKTNETKSEEMTTQDDAENSEYKFESDQSENELLGERNNDWTSSEASLDALKIEVTAEVYASNGSGISSRRYLTEQDDLNSISENTEVRQSEDTYQVAVKNSFNSDDPLNLKKITPCDSLTIISDADYPQGRSSLGGKAYSAKFLDRNVDHLRGKSVNEENLKNEDEQERSCSSSRGKL